MFKVFVEYTQRFYFSMDFYYFFSLSFSCCPAESDSVGIIKISLLLFKLCAVIFRKNSELKLGKIIKVFGTKNFVKLLDTGHFCWKNRAYLDGNEGHQKFLI